MPVGALKGGAVSAQEVQRVVNFLLLVLLEMVSHEDAASEAYPGQASAYVQHPGEELLVMIGVPIVLLLAHLVRDWMAFAVNDADQVFLFRLSCNYRALLALIQELSDKF